MEKPKLMIDGKRLDGRDLGDVRPLAIKARVLNDANGSAYVHWGKNKVLAGVYGPRECIPKHFASPYGAIVKCRYNMAPFCSLEEHGRSGPSRRSHELSKVIKEVFENVILAESFPKTQIDIYIEILQSDGGTRCAAITAASVALADAGIPMKDLVAAVAVGKIEGKMGVDLSKEEDNSGESDMPIAFANRNGEILLLQMDGRLTPEEIKEGIEMAQNACKNVNALQAAALKEAYEGKNKDMQKLDLTI